MISCNEYDYIEIACMYRFSIRLTLKSGKVIEGTAIDTARNQRAGGTQPALSVGSA